MRDVVAGRVGTLAFACGAAVIILLAASCGRIGFEAQSAPIDAGAVPDAACNGTCPEGTACAGNQCVSCTASCGRPAECGTMSIGDTSDLRFGEPTALVGLGDAPAAICGATQDDRSCGFARSAQGYVALCSRSACGSEQDGRLRPHVLTSTDGVTWTYAGEMVENPQGYWNGSSFAAGFPTYFNHSEDYPIVTSDGSYLAVASSYFQWIDGQWVDFIARWDSPDGISWSGYTGVAGDETQIVTWGAAVDVGAASPSVVQLGDESFVAYAREAPHVSVTTANPYAFRRFTSTDATTWLVDVSFDFNTDETIYPGTTGVGRIFGIGSDLYAYNHQVDDGDEGVCSSAAQWRWATSSTGLQGSFASSTDALPWIVGCQNPVPACDVRTPFFLLDGTNVRVFYRDGESTTWYTALSLFKVAP